MLARIARNNDTQAVTKRALPEFSRCCRDGDHKLGERKNSARSRRRRRRRLARRPARLSGRPCLAALAPARAGHYFVGKWAAPPPWSRRTRRCRAVLCR
eukprot:scaffold68527_cov65-Phaeocystis_antarctica.AAC.4